MCFDPVTLTIAATAISSLGSLASVASGLQQARYQESIADFNARMSDAAAADAIERGKIENLMHGRRVAQMKGTQQATMAANAVDPGFGSALQTLTDTAMMGAEDSYFIGQNAVREAMGYDISAASYRGQAASARSSRAGIILGGVSGLGSSILGGAQQMARLKIAKKIQLGQASVGLRK